MRKAHRREQEEEEEKRIQKENAEVQERNDGAAEEEQRRMTMTRKREHVIELMSQELQKTQNKNDQVQQAAESAAAKATMEEINTLKRKQEQMYNERHNDWLNLQKERQARKRTGVKRAFPTRKQEVDEEAFALTQRKREAERIKEYQKRQAAERRLMEKLEIENSLKEDQKMLQATQEKFNRQLEQLQNFIPPELGITVPTFTVQ